MERLLRLLYHGEVSVGRDELDQLLKVGEALQIKGNIIYFYSFRLVVFLFFS